MHCGRGAALRDRMFLEDKPELLVQRMTEEPLSRSPRELPTPTTSHHQKAASGAVHTGRYAEVQGAGQISFAFSEAVQAI